MTGGHGWEAWLQLERVGPEFRVERVYSNNDDDMISLFLALFG